MWDISWNQTDTIWTGDRGPNLEEMACTVLAHEDFKLIIKQLALPDLIHHFSCLDKLQNPYLFPAETAPTPSPSGGASWSSW
jgi:hypothetical protein